jgi:CheY-like chemotaxis protein
VLIVDDYADALEIWGLYLRMAGYEVLTADTGPAAIDAAQREHPDIIIMDLELPGMTGIEVARALRGAHATARIPLIAATGYSHAEQLKAAEEAGFDVVLVKPCDPAELVGEIQRLAPAAPSASE